MTKSNIAKIACAILLSTVLCAASFQSALSLPAPIKPAPITVLSASSAPAPPSDVKLIKDEHNLVVKWQKSNTADVKYKIEVLNKAGGTVYAVDNLSNSLSEYTFSNVRANNYASAKVYAVLDGQTSFAQSAAGVYFELSAVDRESSFADISKLSEESKKAIIWCFGYGVTVGTDSKHYSPSRILTREQMAVFLYRMSGSPKIDPNLKASFKDIKNSFSKKAIIWLYNSGITSGTSKNYFSPKKQVSRSQMAIFLYRLASSPEVSGKRSSFADIGDLDNLTKNAILWLELQDITTGTSDGHYSPSTKISRNQMALFLKRYSDTLVLSPFIKNELKNNQYFLTTGVKRSDITSLEFLASVPKCSNLIDLTDSNFEPGSILACVNGTDVVVGQKGGVIANLQSSDYLFNNLSDGKALGSKLNIENFDAFNTENMNNIFEDANLENDLVFPTNFGMKTKKINNFGKGLKIQNGNFILKDSSFSKVNESEYILAFSKISGKIIFGENCFQNATKLPSFFTNSEIEYDIIFGEGFAKNVVQINYMFQNIKTNGDIYFSSDFGENVKTAFFIFYGAEIKTSLRWPKLLDSALAVASPVFQFAKLKNLILPEDFLENATSLQSVFQNMEVHDELVLPKSFGKSATNFSSMFSNATIHSNIDWSQTDLSGKAGANVSNMFYNMHWNNKILFAANDDSVSFLTTNTGASVNNIKLK